MKVLIDTNVILDTFVVREPYNQDADKIFDLMADEKVLGHMTASSVTDVYYILQRTMSEADSRNKIDDLTNIVHVIDVTKADVRAAIKSPVRDYEDALIAVCADKEGLDLIVTRDSNFLDYHKAISPSEFLERCRQLEQGRER